MTDSHPGAAEFTADSVRFGCPQCQHRLRCGLSFVGQDAQCPQCGTMVKIPGPESQAAAEEDNGSGVEPSAIDSYGGGQQPPPAAEPSPFAGLPGAESTAADEDAVVDVESVAETAGSQASPFAAGRPLPTLAGSAQSASTAMTPTRELFHRVMEQIRKIFVGQDELVLGTLVALFSGGHVLIESFPGLGKTIFVRTLGRVLGCQFGRIQFTADLMPSDITGSPIYDMKNQEFRFHAGPVFTQLLLADEINRSPAKTHAALLEIMQEYNVTVDGTTHNLDRPFLVMATQNPIESEGTYNLPEAQLDRFMFKLVVEYPTQEEEAAILKMHSTQQDLDERLEHDLSVISSPAEILQMMAACELVRVDERLVDYINQVVRLTRNWPQFHLGASPRAGLALMQGARTLAAFRGRDYAVPDDVVELALPCLRHRVILTAEAEVEGHQIDQLLTDLIRSVEVPRT